MTRLSASAVETPGCRIKINVCWTSAPGWTSNYRNFARCGWGEVPTAELTAASSDASFRRYFRWQGGEHSLIVMDAPPPQEDCRPFVKVAQMLDEAGVHVPQVLAADLDRGFLLLTDLGRQTYLDVIDAGNADQLFDDAIEALLKFQLQPLAQSMPAYDEALLRRELQLFPEWYVQRHLGHALSEAQQVAWGAHLPAADRLGPGAATGSGASRLHAAQPDDQRAQPWRPGLSGCGARSGQLRHHLAVQDASAGPSRRYGRGWKPIGAVPVRRAWRCPSRSRNSCAPAI